MILDVPSRLRAPTDSSGPWFRTGIGGCLVRPPFRSDLSTAHDTRQTGTICRAIDSLYLHWMLKTILVRFLILHGEDRPCLCVTGPVWLDFYFQ